MTQSDINKYYKIFGIINLILSILPAVIQTEIGLMERIITVVALNAAYHMFYLFFSSISKDSTRMSNNFNKIVGTAMIKLFSIFGIITSFILIYLFFYNVIKSNEYHSLFLICIPFGIFFGSYSLWIDLKNE